MRTKPTSRFKRTDMFSRRIVITIPRSGAFVLAIAIGIALWFPASAGKFLSALGIITSVVAILTVSEARHQIRTFRFEMQEALVARLVDDPEEIPDADLREMEDEFNGEVSNAKASIVRLPIRSNSRRRNIP